MALRGHNRGPGVGGGGGSRGITILCHVGFSILQAVCALQPNQFLYYKDKAFQGNKI